MSKRSDDTVRIDRRLIAAAVVSIALSAGACTHTQDAQTPPASANQTSAATPGAQNCALLDGGERDECERQNRSQDPPTASVQQDANERARDEAAQSEAETEVDAADAPTQPNSRIRQAEGAQTTPESDTTREAEREGGEDANEEEEAVDTLGGPRS